MKIGPKYKIARKLGASVFEKTQSQKFALAEQKKKEGKKFSRAKTGFASQLFEKQRVKYTYGLSEKQLANYVKEIIKSKSKSPAKDLYIKLEKRLDNIVLRSGLAKTRYQARQMVSHGHFQVNGKKVTIPSMSISEKDTIKVKDSKKDKGLYLDYSERFNDVIVPEWIKVDPKTFTINTKGLPNYKPTELHFDLQEVIQSFKR